MAIKKFKPELMSSTVQNPDVLPEKRGHQFFYMCHPNAWEFVGGEWLPRLKRFSLTPGVNGVSDGPSGYRIAKANFEADGWIFLDHKVPVMYHNDDGELVEEKGYLCSLPGLNGPVYTDVWHTPIVVGMGRTARVDWAEGFDAEGFNMWRKMLVERGFVDVPHKSVLMGVISLQRKRTERNALTANSGNPVAVRRYEDEKDRLEAMEASLAPKPAPAKKPAAKRSTKNVK
jgi:hypothetical protein